MNVFGGHCPSYMHKLEATRNQEMKESDNVKKRKPKERVILSFLCNAAQPSFRMEWVPQIYSMYECHQNPADGVGVTNANGDIGCIV
jgi:hypothetical protein